MADETIIIDVVANFKDKATDAVQKASKSIKTFEKNVDNVTKKKHSVRLDVDDKAATSGIKKVVSSASAFSRKTFKGVCSIVDKASPIVDKAMNKTQSFVRKTWSTTLSVVDKFTSPLTKLKNMLFNVNTLIGAVATGLATKFVVANPVSTADDVTQSTISFQTMLGSEEKGNKMMADIMKFAKDTPFETMGVVEGVQQMMAYGIEAENTLKYMEKIGNVMSAMGKGEEGIDSVTRALGQMRSTGKVNAQDMMQLTSVGIKAWDYLAKGMGKSVAEVRKMSEDGAIDADTAIKHIMSGLSEFDGMMDKMSNTTVKGLWSNIQDTFSQSIVLKWGKGLQKGAIDGLTKFRDWLDRIDPLLSKAGTSLESIGEAVSTKVFSVLDGLTSRFETVVNSDEFKNADLFGKIGIVWDEVIWQPFSDWWDTTGKPKVAEKMQSFGESLGTGISNGLLSILGIDVTGTLDDGASIGASFAEGFTEGFDGEAVGDALWNAIKKAFTSGAHGLTDLLLPGDQGASSGDKILGSALGMFGLVKGPGLYKGAKSMFTGAKLLIGSTGNAMVGGSGILGKFADAGYAITGGAKASTLAGGSGLSGGGAAAVGGGSIIGGILGALGIGAGAIDIVQGITADDSKTKKTELITGASKIGMVGTGALAGGKLGALIGSFGGPVGTGAGALIGAGIGGLGALFGGDKFGQWLSDLTDEGGALSKESITKFFTETIPEKWSEFWGGVGDFFTETVPTALETAKEKVTTFFTETIPEKWDEFWDGVDTFFTETVPYALGFAAGKITAFFTETIPEKWDEFLEGVSTFFTETVPTALETFGEKITTFFTVTIPEKWDEFLTGVGEFFTETIPAALEAVGNNVTTFFTETVPKKWDEFLDGAGKFFTETIPQGLATIGKSITTFFTETVPGYFSGLLDSAGAWISEKASGIWSNIKSGFTAGKGDGGGVANNAAGGFVRSRTLSWLAEEGTPEVVIPLGSHRRERAMSLWQRTGELLGVQPEFNALGGIVGGNVSETPSNAPLASYRTGAPGAVYLTIGNITFEIKSGDNPSDILAAIQAQKNAIVELISEALYEALVSQFSNTPLAVG